MPKIYGPKWGQGWQARLDYTTKGSITANESEITAKLYIYAPSAGSFNDNPTGPYYTIQGGPRQYKKYRFDSAGWKYMGLRTFTIGHDSDGTKSVRLYAEWHSDNPTAYTPASLSVSKAVNLPRIPRASSVSASGLTIGQPGTLRITRASSGFVHDLSYRAGGKLHKIATKVTTSASWTPPASLLAEIPDSTKGKIPIVCTTYSGGSKIGTSEDEVSVAVPSEIRPTIQSVTISPVTENEWIAGQKIFVQHYSKARVITKATAGEGSSIASVRIDTGVTTATGSDWTSGLLAAGERTFTITVTDKRGRSVSKPVSFFVYAYDAPQITGIIALRANSIGTPNSGGDHLLSQMSASFSDLGGLNKLTLRVRIGAPRRALGDWTQLENGKDKIIPGVSPDSTYIAEFEAVDLVGNSRIRTQTIPTEKVVMHFRDGGNGAALGKVSEKDGTFEVAWDIEALKDITVGGKSVLGLMHAVAQETKLPVKAQMAPGWKLSPDGISAKLVGNVLRLSIAVESTSTIQPGDFQNKDICTVSITHGGRITSHSNAGNNTAFTGGLAAFYTSGSRNDGNVLSFDFKMSSLAIAGSSWSCYMLFQVAIDPVAFLG